MRIFSISVLVLLVFLGSHLQVQAQTAVVFDRMHIDIWPEHDRPDVLVIYRIQLASPVSLPAQVSLRIPREVGALYNLAWEDMDGLLYNLSYSSEVQGEWIKVTFTTPSAAIQVEYYDPRLERGEEQRRYQYSWAGDYTVNQMSVSVAQPRTSTEMQIYPSFGSGQPREDGLMVYDNNIGEVSVGTSFRVTLRYTKTDDELSVGLQPVSPVQPLDGPTTTGRVGMGSALPFALVGLGVVLLLAGVAAFLVTREQSSHRKRTRKKHVTVQTRKEKPQTVGESTYCHHCGKRSAPADIFCRICGTRLRVGD